ncbi:winged helix DNA-binding domain-containing protein [Paenibacillus flagellatus]|uniref:Winged helix DNA-binding domain-containing protein n=1 Tax=Paenibacillus flagellatus TaxID=2211139 RepID=A0A2V5JZT3_9BACL|nr:winged helix DNA-binding domain-containing protein [Paenibacillus flagellatus]PYI52465.1 winged helix DNA-binding domain-containing protein [Paenibacillus flagellatus]
MANRAIASRRLLHQRIVGAKEKKPEDVIRHLGALQAQDYGQAIWGIGLRTEGGTAADVERAIEEQRIVLTWAMRGTLHAVPAADVKWMLKLLAPRVLAQDKRRLEQLEIAPEHIAQCEALMRDALQGGRRISRPTLMQMMEEAGIGTRHQRGYHLLWHLAQLGLICLGPLEGKQQTFVLLDEWVREENRLSLDEALGELAKRYFTSHGPATVHDFAWWSGLKVSEARQGVEAAQRALDSVTIDGDVYWLGADGPGEIEEQVHISLLPGFDEYLLGYKDRGAVLAAEHAPLLVPGGNGVFAPMLVIDGQIAGIWKRTMKKNGVDISVHPFAALGDRRERVVEEVRRYGEWLGLPISRLDFQEE